MKLKIKMGKEDLGNLECNTMPGVSHKFELNKKKYEIIKVSETELEVTEIPMKTKPGVE